jgi:hypothetical protein
METCSVLGCEALATHKAAVLCERHYTRVRRYGDAQINKRPELEMSLEERFWSKVDKNGPIPAHRPELGPCWLWTARISTGGYGAFQIGKRPISAHVAAWELVHGPIPTGVERDHLCRVRRCVRPDHLEPVTHQENVLRGEGIAARQAQRTHCPKGHPYDAENTRIYRGRRFCRACAATRYVKTGKPPLKTHCPRGHEYTPENTYVRGSARSCRLCGREATRRWQERQG